MTWHGVEREVLGFWAYSFILKNKELTRYERLRDKRFTAKGDFGFADEENKRILRCAAHGGRLERLPVRSYVAEETLADFLRTALSRLSCCSSLTS